MTYWFKWRRRIFWKSVEVVGHHFDKDQDKMILHFSNGGAQEIKHWSRCEIRLGSDWAHAMKRHMEQQAGTSVPTTF